MAKLGRLAKQREKLNIILGVLALLVITVITTGVWWYLKERPKEPNPITLCPHDGAIGHYVLLVDKTDPLTFIQKQTFSVTLRELIEKRIPEGFLISVFVLGEDFKENATPLIELCNPGSDEGKNEYTSHLGKLRQKYNEKFLIPLLKQSEALLAVQPSKNSPILEMLQLVSINAFRKHNIKGERRLIIMSDMLHNMPQMSMYKGPVNYSSFAATDYGKRTQLELEDVAIELHYLINAPQLQTRLYLQFWEEYFEKAKARIKSVRPLEG